MLVWTTTRRGLTSAITLCLTTLLSMDKKEDEMNKLNKFIQNCIFLFSIQIVGVGEHRVESGTLQF